MTTAVTTVGSSSQSTMGSTSTTALSDANASQDRFLKLLVAQLNNQDPMNPMDNAQMTSQMAQINTVTGITQLNETMKSMASQFTSMQMLQGTSMIGHDVLIHSNTLSVDGGAAKGAFDLSANADKVTMQVFSPGGQVIDTVELGPMGAGRQNFAWDASNYTEGGNPTFKITATAAGKNVPTTTLARDTVVSVGLDGTSMSLQLKGRNAVTYDAIQAVL